MSGDSSIRLQEFRFGPVLAVEVGDADPSLQNGDERGERVVGRQRFAFQRHDLERQFEFPRFLGNERDLDRNHFLIPVRLDLEGRRDGDASVPDLPARRCCGLRAATARSIPGRPPPGHGSSRRTTTVFFTNTVGLTSRSSVIRSTAVSVTPDAPIPDRIDANLLFGQAIGRRPRIGIKGRQGPLGAVGDQQDADDLLSRGQLRHGVEHVADGRLLARRVGRKFVDFAQCPWRNQSA